MSSLDEMTALGENLTPVVTAVRWATAAGALLLLSTRSGSSRSDAIGGAIVLAFALWRTVRPVIVSGDTKEAVIGLLMEGAVMVSVVVGTGEWDSPYVLGIFTVVSLAGLSGGIRLALVSAAACVVAVAVPYHLSSDRPEARLTAQWAGEIALIGAVTGYARRVTLRKTTDSSAFLGRLEQLSEANALLLELHRVATTLPMSLDLSETLASSAIRLNELFDPSVLVILVRNESSTWNVVRSVGVQIGEHLLDADVPAVLSQAGAGLLPQLLAPLNGAGLSPESTSGIYAPLRMRQELVGLVGLEREASNPLGAPQLALMEAFSEQMAVAIDNGRWFSRIGTLAAERERNRIARDLHDSVGQSLALVGFELDRAAKAPSEMDVRRQLEDLRVTVRTVVGDLRETLHDLRTDVSEEYSLSRALAEFIDRVGSRSGLQVVARIEAPERFPLAVEREIWRISQEAVTNVERHAHASVLTVEWTTDEAGGILRIADDGQGMESGEHRRPGGYGLVGMQERADAIGASLTITSAPASGTEVIVALSR